MKIPTTEEKQDIYDRWIHALRNSEEKQCQGKLYNGEAHCALGLLWVAAGGVFKKEPKASAALGFRWAPYGLENFGGVNDSIDPYDLTDDLIGEISADAMQIWELNDKHRGKSFAEIADILEEKYPVVSA